MDTVSIVITGVPPDTGVTTDTRVQADTRVRAKARVRGFLLDWAGLANVCGHAGCTRIDL